MNNTGLIISSLFLIFFGCEPETNQNTYSLKTGSRGFVTIQGQHFVDPNGRQIIFHGINLVNKNKSQNYLGEENPELFGTFKSWGFNCIRLGIIWDGLEPQPGKYNEHYLEEIIRRINWAKKNNLYVILDMHQDLFSVKFSDGAPEWATLTEDKPHITISPVWSDSYFTSPAVQAAFDNFWKNSPAPDGIGIQDHYANLWTYIARRFAHENTIIGYDIMNEPFIGSAAAQVQPLMFSKGAQILAEIDGTRAKSAEELAQMWITPDGRSYILERLSDISIYQQIVDATQPVYTKFENTELMAMYEKVTAAIRKVDKDHIIFLETTIASNMGTFTGLQPIKDKNGNREFLQSYAPHGYDLVTDTRDVSQGNTDRIEFIFKRHGESQERLNMPMLVGEWGAYGFSENALLSAQWVVRQFEKLLCGETYWAYEKNIEATKHFPAIQRPFPDRIAGILSSYFYDLGGNTFNCVWVENKNLDSPTQIYIPGRFILEKNNIKLSPREKGFQIYSPPDTTQGFYIYIPPSGKSIERNLEIHLN